MRFCRRRTSSICRIKPVLKARLRAQRRSGQGVRRQLGLRVGRDRLAQARRAQGHRSHRHRQPQRHARRDRHRRREGRQDGACARSRSAANAAEAKAMVDAVEAAGVPNIGLVQLPPRPGGRRSLKQLHRRRPARPHLPLPRQVPAGLDDLRGSAAGRRRPVAARRQRRRQRRHRRPARALHRHRAVAERRRSPRSRR